MGQKQLTSASKSSGQATTAASRGRHALPLGRRLISGSAWAFAGRVLTAITGLLANALVTRVLPPADVGAYFLLVSLVAFAVLVAQLGMQRGIVRLVAESLASHDLGRAHSVVIQVIRVGLLASIVVAGVVWLNRRNIGEGLFHSRVITDVMWLGALWIVARAILGLIAEGFRGFHDIRLATLFNGLASNAILVLLLYLCLSGYFPQNLSTVVICTLAAILISLAVAAGLMFRLFGNAGSRHPIASRRLMEVGLPLLVTSLMIFLLGQVDLWIVGAYRPESEVAIYGAATRLVQLVTMPLMIVNAVLPPIIADLYSRNQTAQLEKLLRGMAALAGIPAAAALTLLVTTAPYLLGLVYGDFYRGAATPVILISFGQLVNVWAGSGILVLMMTENQSSLMKITVAFTALLIGGDLLAAPAYGVDGVAAVSAAVVSGQALCILFVVRRATGMWTHFGMGNLWFMVKRLTQTRALR